MQGILTRYKDDELVLMRDIYNEPGSSGNDDKSIVLLELTWKWAQDVRPSQPLTACLDGSKGKDIIAINADHSDVITFHC